MIQHFYNGLRKKGLAPKTVKIIHGVLHESLRQAVAIGYLRVNPSDACTLPRIVKKAIKPLDDDTIRQFLAAIQGHRFELLYLVTLFTGMREGEILGLAWDRVDFDKGTLLIDQQLQQAVNANQKMSFFAGMKCNFMAVSMRWVCSLDYPLLAGLKPVKF